MHQLTLLIQAKLPFTTKQCQLTVVIQNYCYHAIAEYYVIANVTPMGTEQPHLSYYGLQNLYKIFIDHLLS